MSRTLPGLGRIVLYRTDGRNGLSYDLPAIVTVTPSTHPGDYPNGERNPLPVPDDGCVHLTVFSPGGFGTTVEGGVFVGATEMTPGSGTYVEHNVPYAGVEPGDGAEPPPRSWRWPLGFGGT